MNHSTVSPADLLRCAEAVREAAEELDRVREVERETAVAAVRGGLTRYRVAMILGRAQTTIASWVREAEELGE